MLPKLYSALDAASKPRVRRFCNGEDVTSLGAFAVGSVVEWRVEVPRSLGAAAVVLRIAPDGGADNDHPLLLSGSDRGVDTYTLAMNTATLCDEDGGLLYYEILFLRGEHTLFTDSIDNVDFSLKESPARRFRLLLHRADLATPAWFSEGTMYHIFLDRFCRGEGPATLGPNAELDPDWENGIPRFALKNGDPLANNVFFGGNLWGVIEKLDYLASLGVTVLYLSPIFEAASNHRYDTADYERVDALLGGDEAFDALIREAHRRGMRVILDGVFNHTGADSRYFNRYATYNSLGAYQSTESPFYPWFRFRSHPDEYEAWWGIEILPRLNHENETCRHYFTSPDGIAARWIARGADGWRLDVADELSDDFLDELRVTVKQASDGDALILGEVWENAADKMAYGKRRRYFRGKQLDSVMNYPFRNAVLALLQHRDVPFFVHTLTEIYASYPRPISDSLMNLLGTHDTCRILTVLGDGEGEGYSNTALSRRRLTPEQKQRGVALLKIASTLQFTVYGTPSVYYGDEVGLEGYHDPFCRMPYPWGREDTGLLAHYRMLGALRRQHPALHRGSFAFLDHGESFFVMERKKDDDRVLVAVNMGDAPLSLPLEGAWVELLSQKVCRDAVTVPPTAAVLLLPYKR